MSTISSSFRTPNYIFYKLFPSQYYFLDRIMRSKIKAHPVLTENLTSHNEIQLKSSA